MQELDLSTLPVAGALSRDRTPTGVVFARLPHDARRQLPDPGYAYIVRTPAGVRLELHTDARALELDAMLTFLQIGDDVVPPATFDLVVDGEPVASVTVSEGTLAHVSVPDLELTYQHGTPVTVRFADLPGDPNARVEVWLPHTAAMELRAVRVSAGAIVSAVREARPRWVHHGSSISQCAETRRPVDAWPVIVARRNGWDLQSLGFSGSCHLDQLVARTIRDLPVDLISLKAGINVLNSDTMRERTFVPALHGFLDTVRDGHPTTPLVVATPIACPCAEDVPGPTVRGADGRFDTVPRPAHLMPGALTLSRVRELITQVVGDRRRDGDENLHLVDGLSLFGPADVGDLPDGLHPNEAGYRRIAERFSAIVTAPGGAFAAA